VPVSAVGVLVPTGRNRPRLVRADFARSAPERDARPGSSRGSRIPGSNNLVYEAQAQRIPAPARALRAASLNSPCRRRRLLLQQVVPVGQAALEKWRSPCGPSWHDAEVGTERQVEAGARRYPWMRTTIGCGSWPQPESALSSGRDQKRSAS